MAHAAEMVRDMQMTMKRNADDLREELADLEKWEDDVRAKEEARKKRTVVEPDLPPVRGAPKPAKPSKPKEDPIKVAKDEGNEYFRQVKFEEAVRSYTRGINMDPDSHTTHVLYANRAMCYLKLSMWDLAEKDASTCIQMNRTYTKAFYRRALARKSMGKLKDARGDLETVLVLTPGDADADRELKVVTAQLVEQDKAAKAATAGSSSGAGGAAGKKKKKLVIEEVDDDEDEPAPSSSGPSAAELERKRAEEEEEQRRLAEERAKRQEQDQRKAREAEQARAQERARQAKAEEKAREARRRNDSCVEEIPSDDDEEPAKPAPAVPPPSRSKMPDPAPPADSPPKSTKAAAKHADPAPRRVVAELTAASLSAPKAFIDFENTYSDIMKKQPTLLGTYLAMLPTGNWRSVFGSSMTPDILADIFKATMAMELAEASATLAGAGSVNRIAEVIMFMDDADVKVGRSAIDRCLKAGGAHDAALRKFLEQF